MAEPAARLPADDAAEPSAASLRAGLPGSRSLLTGLHARVLNEIGLAICAGRLAPGALLYIDELAERHAVSRSVVREVLRVLASMALVESRRRLGTRILPASEWNVYDPQVIRWRLASEGRLAQLRSIMQLRGAVEPEAARLGAELASPAVASDLVGLAARMWAAGQRDDEQDFLALDIEFHRLVLASSGNEMFVKLHELVAALLTGRHDYGLMPHHPRREALELHADVAQAIQRHDGERARASMVSIMDKAMGEMKELWARTSDGP